MEDEEYELISHEEVARLKREIEHLKSNPFIQNSSEERFYEAVSNLTEAVNKLHVLFENVNKQLMKEYETGNSPEEKIDKILDQNTSIAEAMVSFGTKIEALQEQIPQQQYSQQQYESQQYSQDSYALPDMGLPLPDAQPQVSYQQSQPFAELNPLPQQQQVNQVQQNPIQQIPLQVQQQTQNTSPQAMPQQVQMPVFQNPEPQPLAQPQVKQQQTPVRSSKNKLQPMQPIQVPKVNVPQKEVPFQSGFPLRNQDQQEQTSSQNQAPFNFNPPQMQTQMPLQQTNLQMNQQQPRQPQMNQRQMFRGDLELNYPVPDRFQPLNEPPSMGAPIDVQPHPKKKGILGLLKK